MIRARKSLLLATAALVALGACTDPGRVGGTDDNAKAKRGAVIGGIVGAAAGLISGDNKKESRQNALKGAVIGAGVGGITGSILDRQEAALRRDMGNDNVDIVNTGDRLIVTLPQDILFATDSATLRPDLRADLRTVASNLLEFPDTTVQVIGHTDNVGDAGYNQQLSNRRASAVSSELMANGVPSSRIQSFGRGEDQPIASNLTAEGRAQNRRVEIVILPNA